MLKMKINSPQPLNLKVNDGGSTIVIDDFPKENSKNAVSSGGVYQGLKELDNKIENIDLSDYAKKEYVDEAIKNVEVDLTGYATEEYVNKAVANVSVDLSDYYTKEEVDKALENVDVDVDLTNYYTKDELDNELDNLVETFVDDKLGDIDTILTEIVGSTLEVDNKEY